MKWKHYPYCKRAMNKKLNMNGFTWVCFRCGVEIKSKEAIKEILFEEVK